MPPSLCSIDTTLPEALHTREPTPGDWRLSPPPPPPGVTHVRRYAMQLPNPPVPAKAILAKPRPTLDRDPTVPAGATVNRARARKPGQNHLNPELSYGTIATSYRSDENNADH